MGAENQDGEQDSEEVTVVVNRKIKPGCEKDYDEWLTLFDIRKESTWLSRNNNDHGNKHRFNCEAYNSQI
jgi:antibiotic biosynthesis monooxygenase (ABM) superfamily enzyme